MLEHNGWTSQGILNDRLHSTTTWTIPKHRIRLLRHSLSIQFVVHASPNEILDSQTLSQPPTRFTTSAAELLIRPISQNPRPTCYIIKLSSPSRRRPICPSNQSSPHTTPTIQRQPSSPAPASISSSSSSFPWPTASQTSSKPPPPPAPSYHHPQHNKTPSHPRTPYLLVPQRRPEQRRCRVRNALWTRRKSGMRFSIGWRRWDIELGRDLLSGMSRPVFVHSIQEGYFGSM